MAKPLVTADPGGVLQPATVLSRSQLFAMQQKFYAQAGLSAWSQGTVPSQVTTNPVMAAAYARVVLGYLRDLFTAGAIDPSQPLYVLDVGAGTGRLTYLLHRQLAALLASLELPPLDLRYVLVDLGDANLPAHLQNPRLRPLLDRGTVACAALPPETTDAPPALQLWPSGTRLTPQQLKNPLIVLCNYFFDSIPHDAFRVHDGQLQECLLTLRAPAADGADPSGLLSRLQLQLTYRPLAEPISYYPKAQWNHQLAAYARGLPSTHFLFPVGPLHWLRWLAELSGQRLLLLAADKGYDYVEQIRGYQNLALAIHGSFSLPVNFHAIAQVAQEAGFTVLRTPRRESQLKILGLCQGPRSAWPETTLAFSDHLGRAHPSDRHRLLRGAVMPAMEQPLGYLLALLRLSEYDPWFVLTYKDTLTQEAALAPATLQHELVEDLARVWENYFPLGNRRDLLSTAIARILRSAGCAEPAAGYAQLSEDKPEPEPALPDDRDGSTLPADAGPHRSSFGFGP